MSAKAGEVARETGRFRCEGCGQEMMVSHGEIIGECENCGSPSFQTGWRKFDNRPAAVLDGIG